MESGANIMRKEKVQQFTASNELDRYSNTSNENIKIGLEIHCQLTSLNTKLFCGCYSNYREHGPNENVCPICLGLPGSLPLLNKKAVEYASMICIAFNCNIPEKITFYRKNYFYPDLPKNFQITQYNSYELRVLVMMVLFHIKKMKVMIMILQLIVKFMIKIKKSFV